MRNPGGMFGGGAGLRAGVLGLAWAMAGGGAVAQTGFDALTGITLVQPPEAAQVGVGDGTLFSVQASAAPGVTLLGYQWRRNGRPVTPGGTQAQLRVSVQSLADAADYSVDIIGSKGTRSTLPVRLDVVSGGWAPLGGRALALGGVAVQPPSLMPCGGLHLAWVGRPGSQGQLHVHRFDGWQWQRVGGSAEVSDAGSDAGEPSLQCSQEGGTWPVVAFSQSDALGRGVRVRRFDGRKWQPVGSVPAPPGGQARAPVLRLVPSDNDFGEGYSPQHIVGGSQLAWRDGGTVRTASWSSLSWIGGASSGHDVRAHDLAIDTALRGPQGRLFPHLLALADHPLLGLNTNRWQPRVQSDRFGPWADVGAPVAPLAAAGVPVRVLGLGFAATENSRPRVVLAWAEGEAAYSVKSATLFSADYETAMGGGSSSVAWQPYAADLSGSGLLASAFDAQAQEPLCPGAAAPFALALTDSRGTRVWRAECGASGLPAWRVQGGPLPRTGRALALQVQGAGTPVLASVEDGPKGPQLTVWKLYP